MFEYLVKKMTDNNWESVIIKDVLSKVEPKHTVTCTSSDDNGLTFTGLQQVSETFDKENTHTKVLLFNTKMGNRIGQLLRDKDFMLSLKTGFNCRFWKYDYEINEGFDINDLTKTRTVRVKGDCKLIFTLCEEVPSDILLVRDVDEDVWGQIKVERTDRPLGDIDV